MAQPYYIGVSPHGWNSTGIGAAAALHASATMPNFLIYEYMVGAEAVSRDMTKNYNEPVDGYLELPTAPGLGIEIDESKIGKYKYEQYPKRGIRTVEDERKWH
jgi:galactonate dehydratase